MEILIILFASSSLILLALFISLLFISFKNENKKNLSKIKSKEDMRKIKKHISEDDEDDF